VLASHDLVQLLRQILRLSKLLSKLVAHRLNVAALSISLMTQRLEQLLVVSLLLRLLLSARSVAHRRSGAVLVGLALLLVLLVLDLFVLVFDPFTQSLNFLDQLNILLHHVLVVLAVDLVLLL